MSPSLGKCCECEREGPDVHNILMLHKRSPEPGLGCWGCIICDLESAGAVAVLCNDCILQGLDDFKIPKYACLGPPRDNRRIPVEQLTEAFDHDESKHDADDEEIELIAGETGEAIDEIIEEAIAYAEDRKETDKGNGHA